MKTWTSPPQGEILGHREIEMTFLTYSHLAPAHMAKAEDKLWGNLE